MFSFGRKKTEPKPMTAFQKRMSIAQKQEEEERRSGGSVSAATDFVGKSVDEVIKGEVQEKKKSVREKKATLVAPPPPIIEETRKMVDKDFIEFTVVPLLLRAGVAYDEANRYGDTICSSSQLEVDVILTSAISLSKDIHDCHIKVPPGFEKALADDMFWSQKTRKDRGKSFVYYKPSDAGDEAARPKSDSLHHYSLEAPRARASFSGPQLASVGEAATSSADKFKVKSRSKQAESISNDLVDLMATLESVTKQKC